MVIVADLSSPDKSITQVLTDIGVLPCGEDEVVNLVQLAPNTKGEMKPVNIPWDPKEHDEWSPVGETWYLTGGVFIPGSLSRWLGRRRANLARTLWLVGDSDLHGFLGVDKSEVYQMSEEELAEAQARHREAVESAYQGIGLALHRLDSSGWGLATHTYMSPEVGKRTKKLPEINKVLVEMLNAEYAKQSNGRVTNLFDEVKDAGTRYLRLPGSANLKVPERPREVKTLLMVPLNEQVRPTLARLLEMTGVAEADRVPVPRASTEADASEAGFPLAEKLKEELVTLVSPYWTDTQRNQIDMRLAGLLAYNMVPKADAVDVLTRVFYAGNGDTLGKDASEPERQVKKAIEKADCDFERVQRRLDLLLSYEDHARVHRVMERYTFARDTHLMQRYNKLTN